MLRLDVSDRKEDVRFAECEGRPSRGEGQVEAEKKKKKATSSCSETCRSLKFINVSGV